MTGYRSKLLATQLALILGVCYFFFFFGLGAFGLTGADEPRYAQIAREMLARHDWIVPTLNGSPWQEKPALLYWKMMNSYAVFGVSDWAARVPAAFHAAAVAFGIFFFMRCFRFGSELDAAMIAASSAGMIGFGRGASTDMLVSAPFALAMMCWWLWHWQCLWWVRTRCCGAMAKFLSAACRFQVFFCLRPSFCHGIWRCSTKCRSFSASFLLSTIWSALAQISISTHNPSGITFRFFCWRPLRGLCLPFPR